MYSEMIFSIFIIRQSLSYSVLEYFYHPKGKSQHSGWLRQEEYKFEPSLKIKNKNRLVVQLSVKASVLIPSTHSQTSCSLVVIHISHKQQTALVLGNH